MTVMSSDVDANLDNIKNLEGDRIQQCDGSLNIMSSDEDANLDDIKELEGNGVQHCDGSFGLSHVDEIPSLVIHGNCCHHAVIGCWLAVLALPLCRHDLLLTVMLAGMSYLSQSCSSTRPWATLHVQCLLNRILSVDEDLAKQALQVKEVMLVCAQICWCVLRYAGVCLEI